MVIILTGIAAGIVYLLFAAGMAEAKTWRGTFDSLYWDAANGVHEVAVWLKATAQKESSQNRFATNPEGNNFTATQVRSALQNAVDGGVQFLTETGLNPSLGLLQLRWSTARNLGVTNPAELYEPQYNVSIAMKLFRQMQLSGINLLVDHDAWNVGGGKNWRDGVRNEDYKKKVAAYVKQFDSDFPA